MTLFFLIRIELETWFQFNQSVGKLNICIDCLIKVRGKVILWLKHLSQNFLRVKGHFSGTCRPIADQWTDINFTKTSIEKDGHSPGEFYRRKHNTWYADMYFLQFIVSEKVETQFVTLEPMFEHIQNHIQWKFKYLLLEWSK